MRKALPLMLVGALLTFVVCLWLYNLVAAQ